MGRGLLRDVRVTMAERGYKGLSGFLGFVFSYIFKDYLLSMCAGLAPYGMVALFHRMRGVNIGKDVYIARNAVIEPSYPQLITIEDDVRITHGAVVIAHIKAGYELRKELLPFFKARVRLGKGCFIGLNAVILPGVTVGECAVVSSGSVVYRDVPPYTIVSGNPAKIVKRLKG